MNQVPITDDALDAFLLERYEAGQLRAAQVPKDFEPQTLPYITDYAELVQAAIERFGLVRPVETHLADAFTSYVKGFASEAPADRESQLALTVAREAAIQEVGADTRPMQAAYRSGQYDRLDEVRIGTRAVRMALSAMAATTDALGENAAIGEGFNNAFEVLVTEDGPYKDYTPAEDPTEVVLDLYADLIKVNERVAQLESALRVAIGEISEAADKMNVFGLNHPGGTEARPGSISATHGREDREHMLRLSRRFGDARADLQAVITPPKVEAAC